MKESTPVETIIAVATCHGGSRKAHTFDMARSKQEELSRRRESLVFSF